MFEKIKIIYIHKAFFDKRPPIISVIEHLIELKVQLTLITSGISKSSRVKLINRNVNVIDIGIIPTNKLRKILYFLKFRKRVLEIIQVSNKDVIWVGSADAAIVIGKKLVKFNYILQVQELYYSTKFFFNVLKKYVKNAKLIVVPLRERALLARHFFLLKNLPMVMHNKPFNKYFKYDDGKNDITNSLKKALTEKKIILYQGGIAHVRNSHNLIKLSNVLTDDYIMVLMGPITKKISLILNDYPKTIHINRIDAPLHLQITKLAHIGIIDYCADDLNSVFCAPNKIFEYSKFGIPIIANNLLSLPELRFLKIGETFDYSQEKSFIDSIRLIESYYSTYSKNSLNYFNSINSKTEVINVINKFLEKSK